MYFLYGAATIEKKIIHPRRIRTRARILQETVHRPLDHKKALHDCDFSANIYTFSNNEFQITKMNYYAIINSL